MMKSLSFESGVAPCGAGYHFDTNFGGCVADAPTSTPTTTVPKNFMLYAGIGLGLILLLGAFAGGRASKSSGVAPGTRKRVTKSFWVEF